MDNGAKNKRYQPVKSTSGIGSVGAGSIFLSDISVVLSTGKTLGKYVNGQTIPATGKTALDVLKDIALEYVNPVFGGFSFAPSAQTVEVGTILSGAKTFAWNMQINSGVVPTIDIFDITAGTVLLAGTPNDGNQLLTITTKQLTATGQSQSWRGIGNNISPVSTFNSNPFTITAFYKVFFASVAVVPTNSSEVRVLANSRFTNSGNVFNLDSGLINKTFCLVIPALNNLVSVVDLDALNANLTSSYILSYIQVADASGALVNYKLYTMSQAIPYPSNHRHQITIN